MKLIVLALISLLTASCVQNAGASPSTAAVTWTNPSTYTDGSPFVPATDMKNAIISWGTTPGGAKPNQTIVTGAATSATVPYPGTSGNYYFDVVITDNSGAQSAPSAEVLKSVAFPPSAATNVNVT